MLSLSGEPHAAQVTGMLLELTNSELLTLLRQPETLRDAVSKALQVLGQPPLASPSYAQMAGNVAAAAASGAANLPPGLAPPPLTTAQPAVAGLGGGSECSWSGGSEDDDGGLVGLRRRGGGDTDDDDDNHAGGAEYYEDGPAPMDETEADAMGERAVDGEGDGILALQHAKASSKRALAGLTPAMLASRGQTELAGEARYDDDDGDAFTDVDGACSGDETDEPPMPARVAEERIEMGGELPEDAQRRLWGGATGCGNDPAGNDSAGEALAGPAASQLPPGAPAPHEEFYGEFYAAGHQYAEQAYAQQHGQCAPPAPPAPEVYYQEGQPACAPMCGGCVYHDGSYAPCPPMGVMLPAGGAGPYPPLPPPQPLMPPLPQPPQPAAVSVLLPPAPPQTAEAAAAPPPAFEVAALEARQAEAVRAARLEWEREKGAVDKKHRRLVEQLEAAETGLVEAEKELVETQQRLVSAEQLVAFFQARDDKKQVRRPLEACAPYPIPCTMYTVHGTPYSVHGAPYPVPCALCTLYPMYPVPCTHGAG